MPDESTNDAPLDAPQDAPLDDEEIRACWAAFRGTLRDLPPELKQERTAGSWAFLFSGMPLDARPDWMKVFGQMTYPDYFSTLKALVVGSIETSALRDALAELQPWQRWAIGSALLQSFPKGEREIFRRDFDQLAAGWPTSWPTDPERNESAR